MQRNVIQILHAAVAKKLDQTSKSLDIQVSAPFAVQRKMSCTYLSSAPESHNYGPGYTHIFQPSINLGALIG
jgi:hypothetical protein